MVVPFLIFLVLFSFSCQPSTSKDPGHIPVINLERALKNVEDIFLSDFADGVEYIPLETHPDGLVQRIVHIIPTKDYFIIPGDQVPIKVFSRNGTFVRTIGKIGSGPGEFTTSYSCLLDKYETKLIVNDVNTGKMLVFGLSGNFLYEFKLPYYSTQVTFINSDTLMVGLYRQMLKDTIPFQTYLADASGRLIDIFQEPERRPDMKGIFRPPVKIYMGDSAVYSYWIPNDTMFNYNLKERRPYLVVNQGSKKIPYDQLHDFTAYQKVRNEYITGPTFYLADPEWIITFSFKDQAFWGVYNITNEELRVTNQIDTINRGLLNDIDGGPGFNGFTNFDGAYWYQAFNAIDLTNWMKEGAFDRENLLFEEKNRHLKKMITELDENDNPVIMIVKKKNTHQ